MVINHNARDRNEHIMRLIKVKKIFPNNTKSYIVEIPFNDKILNSEESTTLSLAFNIELFFQQYCLCGPSVNDEMF